MFAPNSPSKGCSPFAAALARVFAHAGSTWGFWAHQSPAPPGTWAHRSARDSDVPDTWHKHPCARRFDAGARPDLHLSRGLRVVRGSVQFMSEEGLWMTGLCSLQAGQVTDGLTVVSPGCASCLSEGLFRMSVFACPGFLLASTWLPFSNPESSAKKTHSYDHLSLCTVLPETCCRFSAVVCTLLGLERH